MTSRALEGLVFVKLGGSVITDKAESETARPEVIARLAAEVSRALKGGALDSALGGERLQLVIGHGSGSFGHMVARRHGTRHGVRTAVEWRGFVEVAAAAGRLNRIVTDLFLAAGVAVWSLQPSASAQCRAGKLVALDSAPLEQALLHGLVPLVYGDVALDHEIGGTIISTEEVFAHLARRLHPARVILVGAVDGVYEGDPLGEPSARRIPEITAANWAAVRGVLAGSHAVDVTGGMLAKVEEMVALARELPGLTVQIISGERAGALESALRDPGGGAGGTVIRWA
jgi:isopentenyl phosphate kinase